MKAIRVRYHGQTSTRGSRLTASDCDGNSVTVPYDSSEDRDQRYRNAAVALCRKMNWTGDMYQGWLGNDAVFVFNDDINTREPNKSKHTPGPWRAEGWNGVVVNDSIGNTLAVFPSGDGQVETAKANAKLIAAAPVLLESLQALMTMEALILEHRPAAVYTIEAARAAIAKATT